MESFYINSNDQDNDGGEHEVHRYTCTHGADPANQVALGLHRDGVEAVAEAKRRWPGVPINGCYWCCPESHTG